MSEVKWIKLDKDIFNNRKIRQIESMPDGDTIIVIWLKILTLAGDVNDGGLVYFTRDIPFTEDLLATEFDRPVLTIRLALQTFERFGMIEMVDNIIKVSNWEKYQSLDRLSELREYNRIAQQKHRAKLTAGDVNDMSMTCQSCQDTDIEEDKNKRKIFAPPLLEELQSYITEAGLDVDAEQFMDYYRQNGWKVGKNKMKDWKATARNWHRRNRQWSSEKTKKEAEEAKWFDEE